MYANRDVLCARQPIFTKKHSIFAYELLYRSKNNADKAEFSDGDVATSELLINACGSINDDEALSQYPLFFNVTRNLMLSDSFFPVKRNTAVIEILENTPVDELLTNRIYKLKRLGYQFALDDYCFTDKFAPLLPFVKFIKVDLLHSDIEQHLNTIRDFKEMGKILVAEKVETIEMFERCKELGFDLFQGFYLERPQIVEGRKINANVNLALRLINELQQSDVSFDKLSYLVSKDPKLSYQLLRILNSPAQGLKREVSSLKQAVVFLGIAALKKWVILISLLQNSDVPDAFFTILLTRARTCELLAESIERKDADIYFMMGLLSGMDRVLNMDMTSVVKHLVISQELLSALLDRSGFMGDILNKVILLERAQWNTLHQKSGWAQAELLSKLMEQARNWTDELLSNIG